MTVDTLYSVGDWIVHNYYGVGQIKKIEKKPIHGEKVRTFRVKTKDSVYWVPVKKSDNPRIRRVVNKAKLRRAIRTIKSKPQKMNKNYKTRNARIKKVFMSGSTQKMAKLLRDLLALRHQKKFNNTEKNAVEKIKERFIREYAICYEIPQQEATIKFSEITAEL
jgi:RNA polymerase-interacting CarD/CdnL/TRCF family regulator